jgi:hypothetical protein
MERKTGFEPATLALARRCSTTEPLPQVLSFYPGGRESSTAPGLEVNHHDQCIPPQSTAVQARLQAPPPSLRTTPGRPRCPGKSLPWSARSPGRAPPRCGNVKAGVHLTNWSRLGNDPAPPFCKAIPCRWAIQPVARGTTRGTLTENLAAQAPGLSPVGRFRAGGYRLRRTKNA